MLVLLAEAFTATWSKYYCTYKKQQKQFSMLQYNQISGKTVSFYFIKTQTTQKNWLIQ